MAAPSVPRSARAAAIVTWVYTAAYGLPAVPIVVYLIRERELPWLLDLFPMYGGPWWSGDWARFVWLMLGYFAVTLALAFSGWLLWRGRRSGAVMNLALVPVEAFFWWGFDLPIPPLFAIARVVLVAVAWRRLTSRRAEAPV